MLAGRSSALELVPMSAVELEATPWLVAVDTIWLEAAVWVQRRGRRLLQALGARRSGPRRRLVARRVASVSLSTRRTNQLLLSRFNRRTRCPGEKRGNSLWDSVHRPRAAAQTWWIRGSSHPRKTPIMKLGVGMVRQTCTLVLAVCPRYMVDFSAGRKATGQPLEKARGPRHG